MRSRFLLFMVLLTAGAVLLPHLAYAKIPYFGPIIPNLSCGVGNATLQTGAGSWGAFIIVINNIISFLITIVIIGIAPLTIGYAGFLLVVNSVNPEGKAKAKTILWQTVIGIVVSLAAYLLVNAVLVVLTKGEKGVSYWTALVFGNNQDICIKLAGSLSPALGTTTTEPGIIIPGQGEYKPLTDSQANGRATVAKRYTDTICAAATANNIPKDQTSQLFGILGVESNGDEGAISPAYAIGLMQLEPDTADNYGVNQCVGSSRENPDPLCVSALQNPTTNINAGVKYFAYLLGQLGNIKDAIAAYNAGNGKGTTSDGKKQAFAPSSDCKPPEYPENMKAWECPINPGGFAETQAYVFNVTKVAGIAGNCQ